MVKKVSAVVNMLNEAAGIQTPTKGATLKMCKKTAVKRINMAKGPGRVRRGTTAEDLSLMIRKIYLEEGRFAS